jgi:hypothetical protein
MAADQASLYGDRAASPNTGRAAPKRRTVAMAAPILGTYHPQFRRFERHVDYIHFNPVKHRLFRAFAIGLFHRFIDLCDKDCYRKIGPVTSVGMIVIQASVSGASDPDFAALNRGYKFVAHLGLEARSPDRAKRYPGTIVQVARPFPDFAALNPGYEQRLRPHAARAFSASSLSTARSGPGARTRCGNERRSAVRSSCSSSPSGSQPTQRQAPSGAPRSLVA